MKKKACVAGVLVLEQGVSFAGVIGTAGSGLEGRLIIGPLGWGYVYLCYFYDVMNYPLRKNKHQSAQLYHIT